MKLIGRSAFLSNDRVTFENASDAVQHVTHKATLLCEDEHDRLRERCGALERMLGNVIDVLIAKGELNTNQINAIFDYNVIVDD